MPQPVISTVGKYSTTDDRRVPLLVDFGERVLEMNPLRLFNTSGFGRWARYWLQQPSCAASLPMPPCASASTSPIRS